MALCLHCESVEVSEEEVRKVQTPQPTDTWNPVPHALILDRVKNEVTGMGLRVVAESYGLWNEGARFFGLLEVQNGQRHDDYGMVIGLRNSHDQSFSLSLAIGSHVFVCDNLAFSGEVVIRTRHTKNVMGRIGTLITRATSQLIEQRHLQDERIGRYKGSGLDDLHAHDLMCRAIRDGVIAPSAVAKVMQEWDQPTHAAFQPRTVWSLFNAFTEVLKRVNPLDMPRRTMHLHGLCDGFVGLACGN
jgi:hypothetical protein